MAQDLDAAWRKALGEIRQNLRLMICVKEARLRRFPGPKAAV